MLELMRTRTGYIKPMIYNKVKCAVLYKIRNDVSLKPLKAIYFPIFDSHIYYSNLIPEQNPTWKLRFTTSQKRLRTTNNQSSNSHSCSTFKKGIF